MKPAVRAVLPLVLAAAVVVGVMVIPSVVKKRTTRPIAIERAVEIVEEPPRPEVRKKEKPGDLPEHGTARGTESSGTQPAATQVTEVPPAPKPRQEQAAQVLVGWARTLKGMAYGSIVAVDAQAVYGTVKDGPLGKLAAMHLKEGVLTDKEGTRILRQWNREVQPALEAAVKQAKALAVYALRLPGDRLDPVVAVVPAGAGAKEAPVVKAFLELIRPGEWEARPFIGGEIMLFGKPEALDTLTAVEHSAASAGQIAPESLIVNIDGGTAGLIARLTGIPQIAMYGAGLREVEGRVAAGAEGFKETWSFKFRPGDTWPLMVIGGPRCTLEGLGDVPGTSVFVTGGFVETDGMLPLVEKVASAYVPGLKLSDLRGRGLEGAGFLAVASPRDTWQPAFYGVLQPRGGSRAIEAFAQKYREALASMQLTEGISQIGEVTAHYAQLGPGQGSSMLLSLIPAWAEANERLYAGMSALGVKEILTGGKLSQTPLMQEIAGELPKEASGIVIIDARRLAYLGYEVYARLFANRLRLKYGYMVSLEALPTPDAVMALMKPIVAYSMSRPQEILVSGSSPAPMALLLAVGVALAP